MKGHLIYLKLQIENKHEKYLSRYIIKFNFFLSFSDNEKGNFILPLKTEDISDISADVVASGPAPSP